MPGLRIDKLLWYLRLAKTRSVAQQWVAAGHVRANGRRVGRAHHAIAPDDILVIPIGSGVRVIEVLSLPVRRGPAPEARACYRVLDEPAHSPLAGLETDKPEGTPIP